MLTYSMIQKLFAIEDAAKNVGLYDIANSVFATLLAAYQAAASEENSVLADIIVAIETEGDVAESLAEPEGSGYYDLPNLLLNGAEGIMAGMCIPLPLLSEKALKYLGECYSDGSLWVIERGEHSRKVNFLEGEEAVKAEEELLQRLHAIFTPAAIAAARAEFLAPRQ